MNFSDWEPLYIQILADFGFTRQNDEDAARLISEIIEQNHTSNQIIPLKHLHQIIAGQEVIVCGNAPSLETELHALREHDKDKDKDRGTPLSLIHISEP